MGKGTKRLEGENFGGQTSMLGPRNDLQVKHLSGGGAKRSKGETSTKWEGRKVLLPSQSTL